MILLGVDISKELIAIRLQQSQNDTKSTECWQHIPPFVYIKCVSDFSQNILYIVLISSNIAAKFNTLFVMLKLEIISDCEYAFILPNRHNNIK